MARWGEGDPRWIVEERPDATNVNNWHWTEKNACAWSESKLKELLVGLKIESDLALVTINEMDKIEGEAVANNRKGKLIFFYEWDMSLSWSGRLKGGTEKCEGKFSIPNLSEENDVSEIEVTVSVKENHHEAEIVKDFLLHTGRDIIREKLGLYISSLKEEFSKGMILPKKGSEESNDCKDNQINNLASGFNSKVQVNQTNSKESSKGSGSSKNLETTTLKLNETFQCTGEDFYKALVTPELVRAFTNSSVVLEPRPNGKFELFGGNVSGEFTELVPNKKVVQRWRLSSWPKDHYSTVTITIDEQSDHTRVVVVQTGIPQLQMEGTKENWERYYWQSIKRIFGWGYFM